MIIKADQIRVGTQLAEEDGFLFEVVEILEETDEAITVRLCSDFSSVESHWTQKLDNSPGGLVKTFLKTTQLNGIA